MPRKLTSQIINKITTKISMEVHKKVSAELDRRLTDLKNDLEKTQQETNSLTREFIIEQRQRDDLRGGILQVTEREIATRIFNDLIMYLDPRDISITPHIALEGIWERWVTMAWITLLDKRDATVLDIGANNGYYGMLAASKLDRKKAHVILFEPNPHLIPYIHKTLSVNWLNENTTVEPLAVSDVDGKAKLNILQDYIGSSSMQSLEELNATMGHKMQIDAEEIVEVETVTIDTYCERNGVADVDLAIMDIEGFEDKAYKGMQRTVKKSSNMSLFIEFTPGGYEKPKQFYNQMVKDFGKVYTLSPKGEFVKPTDNSYEHVVGDSPDYVMLVFSKRDL